MGEESRHKQNYETLFGSLDDVRWWEVRLRTPITPNTETTYPPYSSQRWWVRDHVQVAERDGRCQPSKSLDLTSN